MKLLVQCLAVGLAGFAGSIARFAVALLFGRLFTTSFPLGTLFINVTGSLFLGWFLTYVKVRYPISDTMRLAIGTGFVGAYTTFSTFMWESSKLYEDAAEIKAVLNVLLSLVLGVLAVQVGIILGNRT